MIIYKITNLYTNKIYIGLTVENPKERFRKHFLEARAGSNTYLHNSMNKYGKEAFEIIEIDKASTIEELKEKEKFYIKQLNTRDRSIGYNLSEGGDGTPGVMKSEYTRNLIRQKHLGRKHTEVARKNMSISSTKNAKNRTNYQKHNLETSKKVAKLDSNNNIVIVYPSISIAYKSENMNRSTLIRYLHKNDLSKKCKGNKYQIVK